MSRVAHCRFIFVIHSLMPKGVEHWKGKVIKSEADRVIHSLMPKGVEHTGSGHRRIHSPGVIHSLMPKGVEHSTVQTEVFWW